MMTIHIKMRQAKTKLKLIALLAGCAGALGGCTTAEKIMLGERHVPDEFVIYAQSPLEIPPDFQLHPPKPGAPELRRGTSATELAQQALLGQAYRAPVTPAPAGSSPGVHALLAKAGGLNLDPDIRSLIDNETNVLVDEDQNFIDSMIFWVNDKPYQGTVVDADLESKRILENQSLGRPINEGETVEIKRKKAKKGLLDF